MTKPSIGMRILEILFQMLWSALASAGLWHVLRGIGAPAYFAWGIAAITFVLFGMWDRLNRIEVRSPPQRCVPMSMLRQISGEAVGASLSDKWLAQDRIRDIARRHAVTIDEDM
jgi:hypothetical protein